MDNIVCARCELVSNSSFKWKKNTLDTILYLYWYVTWQYALLCSCATGAIAPHCGFFRGFAGWKLRLRPFFYVNSSSVRRAIWLTWLSEPHDTTSLHACPSVYSTWCVPGGHPSNYGPGPALPNFSDRANTDELTLYSEAAWRGLTLYFRRWPSTGSIQDHMDMVDGVPTPHLEKFSFSPQLHM